ncbi:MAG: hypothetical protein JWN63_1686, partial [Candidatus Acidoferrum typicum]|nr:hypothetical protein [Candidatus Acidoferrum typicum]
MRRHVGRHVRGNFKKHFKGHFRKQRAALVAAFIFAGAALIASCAKPYHQETERYVFVAT